MRIVDRQTFLGLPAGTVFAKYQPCAFDELQIKCDNAGSSDFWALGLAPFFTTSGGSEGYFTELQAVEAGEPSPPFDYEDGEFRDGLFDKEQLFAVFEAHDVDALIARLHKAKDCGDYR